MPDVSREVARAQFSLLLPPIEMERLLRAAGAPEPWELSEDIVAIGTLREHGRSRTSRDRAQDAIAELRRVLPKIISECTEHLKHVSHSGIQGETRVSLRDHSTTVTAAFAARMAAARARDPAWVAKLFAEIDLLRTLLAAVERAPTLVLRLRVRAEWHDDAGRLLEYYRAVVSCSTGVSAAGPAVRFVQLALIRLGFGEKTCDAIAKAIRPARAGPTASREKTVMADISRDGSK